MLQMFAIIISRVLKLKIQLDRSSLRSLTWILKLFNVSLDRFEKRKQG
jgi:hypothetical protein